MMITTAQATSSRASRAFSERRNWLILFCIAKISCAADRPGSLSGCSRQSFFRSSSFILALLLHQSGKFLLCAMQHDANVIRAHACDLRHLFVGQIFEKKSDERLFKRVELENC